MRFDMTSLKTAALAGMLALAPMAASALSVTDFGGDSVLAPAILPTTVLTLDFGATDAAGFDTTSKSYDFAHSFDAGDTLTRTFKMFNTGSVVLTFGNLVKPSDFSTAEVTIGGTTIDLLVDGNTEILVNATGAFDLTLNFADDIGEGGAGSFDFTIEAVPLPAGGLLLLTALGGLGLARRKRKAA